jgi:hypothetical protein
MHLQSSIWYTQDRFKEAKVEALCAMGIFEKLGAVGDVETCGKLLQWIGEEEGRAAVSDVSDSNGELLEVVKFPTPVNFPSLVHGTE